MAWFKRTVDTDRKIKIPEGLWIKCNGCKEIVYKREIDRNMKRCPKCNYHFRINSTERIEHLCDPESFVPMDERLDTGDPLDFSDSKPYAVRHRDNQDKSGLPEAAVSGRAKVEGFDVVLVIMDFSFMGGSMGSVVGEKIVRAAECALREKLPLITVSSSGGARMQEGIFSLMQMARTSAAVGKLKAAGVPFINISADPTFGGVTASFVMLADVIIAEPLSLIGFAGPRVIEQTIKQTLPEDFQRAEFLLQHGLTDMVVDRKDMRETLKKLLGHLTAHIK